MLDVSGEHKHFNRSHVTLVCVDYTSDTKRINSSVHRRLYRCEQCPFVKHSGGKFLKERKRLLWVGLLCLSETR